MNDKIALLTIWQIPDDLWEVIEPLLPARRPEGSVGRPELCYRRVLNGIVYILRTGCQWKHAPKAYGSGSSLHRYFQHWTSLGVFEQTWAILLERYDELVGIGWEWLSADGTMLKAPLGGSGTGPNPTDRSKQGCKRHVLVDQQGVPVAMEIAGANRPDMKLLEQTLDQIVIERPTPTSRRPQHLCLDKGYDYADCDATVEQHRLIAHTRRRGEPEVAADAKRHPPRRWVVERTHSWHNRFRKVLIRFEKKVENYRALVDFASALIVYRTIYRLFPSARLDWVLG